MLKKIITSGCAAALLSVSAIGTAHAQQPDTNKAIYFTFSQPVTLPQVTLPAGKYLFRLADSLVNRQIVQIYSADGSKSFGMLMTIPSIRPDLPDDPEIRFLETGADMPPAVATYWYPGERRGFEFIYPREQAARIAQSAKQPVLTTAQANVEANNIGNADLVRVSPTGEQTPVGSEGEAQAFTGQPTRGEVADNAPAAGSTTASASAAANTQAPRTGAAATTPRASAAASNQTAADMPAATTARNTQTRTALPATASSLPTVLLAGLFALFAAFGVRAWRRAVA